MARRRKNSSPFEDLMSIAGALPWWLSGVLAVVSFVVLRLVALNVVVPAPSGLENMGDVFTRQIIRTFAFFAQFIVPVAFLIGALVSGVRQVRGVRLLAAVAGEGIKASSPGRQGPPMTWREFEILVHEMYRRQGYRVTETGPGADGGIDLVLRRDGERYFVQCKHWQAREVGVRIVRELKGVIAQALASGGAVVTSGRFTQEAVEFALKAGIDLIDGQDLALIAKELHGSGRSARREPVVADDSPAAAATPVCPKCGSSMVLRQARRGRNAGGRFWGCTRFPACRGTVAQTTAVSIQ